MRIVVLASVFCVTAVGCRSDTATPRSATSVVTTTVSTPTTEATGAISFTTTTRPAATDPATTSTRQVTTTTTTTTMVPWPLPDEQAAQVEELLGITEVLRRRSFSVRPDVETLTSEELAERFPDPSAETDQEAVRYQRAFLELLGMATGDTDLEAILAGLNAPRDEPFYDRALGRIIIPTSEGPLDEYESWVLVGALVRALTHQHDPLLMSNRSGGGEDPDRAAARLALIEGEAILIQSLYLASLPPERRQAVADRAGESLESVIDGAPAMLREVARFPAWAGSFLAVELYKLGGMGALDQALARPPDTTEQVLHIDRYREREPAAEVNPFIVEADGYVLMEQGAWGERRWLALLGHYGGAVMAAQAAEGWGGDYYQILWEPDEAEVVFVVRVTGDSFADESEFNAAIRHLIMSGMEVGAPRVVDTVTEWGEGADYAVLAWNVDAMTLLLASDPEVGRRVVSQLGVEL